MGGAYSTHGRVISAYKILVENPEGKRPLGRSRCGWKDTLKWM